MSDEQINDEEIRAKEAAQRAEIDAMLAKMPKEPVAGFPPIWVYRLLDGSNFSEAQEERFLYLLRSIRDGKPETTRQLLPEFDANHQFREDRGKRESLLEWALGNAGHADCIRALLEAGANVAVPGILFRLHHRVGQELLDEFLERGADPNDSADGEMTLLAAYAGCGFVKEMRLLIDRGANLEARSTQGFQKGQVQGVTPLMIAAGGGEVAAVKLLLAGGADVNATDEDGRTALAWVHLVGAQAKREKVLQLLEQAGAKATAADRAIAAQPDLAAMAKTPEFLRALAVAKELTKSAGKKIELAEEELPGAKAFAIKRGQQPLEILAAVRDALEPGKGIAVLSEGELKRGDTCLSLVPVATIDDVLRAFETPEGQRLTTEDLIAWLKKLHEWHPVNITHVAPDLVRGQFLSEISDPLELAKSIEAICSDVINESIEKFAENVAKSCELYLWWD
jgi:ankyrin repeat protein